jgi:hypothetical protein
VWLKILDYTAVILACIVAPAATSALILTHFHLTGFSGVTVGMGIALVMMFSAVWLSYMGQRAKKS